MAGRALRVGVPPILASLPPNTSVARIWGNVLPRLERDGARIVVADPAGRRRWRGRVDVWLTDGHQGPLDVPEPVVCHLHEASWADPELRPLFEPGFLAAYEGPSAEAASAATRILTVSASSKTQIVAAYARAGEDVDVVHNGLDHAVYRPDVEPAAPLLEAVGGDGARPYVLFVSVVHPRKNLEALRGAMADLAGRGFPHALVLVAGPAADRADSAELMAAATAPIPGVGAPVVNLAGADDDDVARLMAHAAVFCLPSLMEGFGMAVAESMACGTPVVVSDRGALPEVVGQAGLVVAPDGPSVAGGLAAVLGDPAVAAGLRARGLQRASAFSWERTAAGIRASLEAALAG